MVQMKLPCLHIMNASGDYKEIIIFVLNKQIAFENAEDQTDREMDVIIDGRIPEEGVYVARSYRDAPEVDGMVFVETERELMSGDIVKVRITGAEQYDLMGVLSDEYSE